MKKVLFAFALFLATGMAAKAQVKTENGDNKTKVKPILTPKDRAHNILHHKHKQSHGVVYKHKNENGRKTRVKAKTSEAVPKKDD